MINNIVVSASMVMIATSAVASVDKGSVELGDLFNEVDESLSAQVSVAMGKKDVMNMSNLMFDELMNSMAFNGVSLSDAYYEEFQLAANPYGSQDSTDVGATNAGGYCYSNCHSNCHSACHGSRGWR